ncbi:hypothetical protein WMM_02778 [Enterococcus faecalis EnGen0364]|nr:hypothetical protein WMM_02825 [Enterococcus faecalis EnGen0364]EOJ55707.1 hypothetical protein WMM_02778 [Enterococcus faecalis EnGen0364]
MYILLKSFVLYFVYTERGVLDGNAIYKKMGK